MFYVCCGIFVCLSDLHIGVLEILFRSFTVYKTENEIN